MILRQITSRSRSSTSSMNGRNRHRAIQHWTFSSQPQGHDKPCAPALGGTMVILRVTAALCAVMAAVCMTRPVLAQENPLERGRYLVETVAFCGVCHNSRGPNGQMIAGMELAGGRVMPMNEMRTVLSNIPPGDIRAVVPNITPDPETGIGRWTDAQIATAIREGRRPDGSIIGPPMPIALYRGLSDRDLMAIVTYLRTVPPKRNAVTQRSTYPFPIEPYGPPIDHVADPA